MLVLRLTVFVVLYCWLTADASVNLRWKYRQREKELISSRKLSRSKRQTIQLYEQETSFFDKNTEAGPPGGRSVEKAAIREVTDGSPLAPQKIRIRGEIRMNSNEGRVEIYDSAKKRWGLVCDGFWALANANVTCRELGFYGAAREAVRSDKYGRGPWTDNDFLRQGVACGGRENSLLDCIHQAEGVCEGKSAGVLCAYNTGCPTGWTAYNGACYHVNVNPMEYKEAERFCKDHDSKLTYILTVDENNFLSNMLYTQFPTVNQAWTGGYYAEVLLDTGKKESRWNWYSTIHNVELWNTSSLWFPGFADSTSSKRPIGDPTTQSCVALSRLYTDPNRENNKFNVNYFWWDNLSCKISLPFLCQKSIPKTRSDCYDGNGHEYRGRITRTTQGSVCAKWTDPSASVNPTSNPNVGLGDHNFCRNPDNDIMPWCWVNPGAGVYGYCAIGKCSEVPPEVTQPPIALAPAGFGNGGCQHTEFYCPSMVPYNRQCRSKIEACDKTPNCLGKEDEDPKFCEKYLCKDNEFYCPADVFCILKSFVCDGRKHCTDGADEKSCAEIGEDQVLKQFDKTDGKILPPGDKTMYYYQVSLSKCMEQCKNIFPQFPCRGFNYLPPNTTRLYTECHLLAKLDTPDQLVPIPYPGAHYCQKQDCTNMFKCKSGLCVDPTKKCNGQNDCGDNSDELNCTASEVPPFEIRFSGSKNQWEGLVEIRYNGEWGYICDDKFDIKAANVVCGMLGFAGALEAVEVATNRFGKVRSPNILLDETVCKGTELSIEECGHDPWRKHDCRPDELAGVVCKVDRACTSEEFRCKVDKICISASKVCDGNKDCSDGSDEPEGKCTLSVTLVGGPDANSGRVEVTRGSSTGTICSQNFDDNDAKVVCKMLNIPGRATAITDKRFGPGSGLVALNNVKCTGTEDSFDKCSNFKWGAQTCTHSDDVGVQCGLPEVQATEAPPTEAPAAGGVQKCGKKSITQPRSRVVGGFEAVYGAFPWQVGVRQKSYDYDYHWCGATILSEDWIISAAHCYSRPKNEYRVRTGDWDNSVPDKYEQQFEIEELILHPNWDSGTYDHDLALIKIERVNGIGITFNNFVQPVCLPKVGMVPDPHTKCLVSGWGDTLSSYPEKLLAAEVPLISATRCGGMYKGRLTERMQCAGFEAGGIDTCQGDSGGPLVCQVQGIHTIFGATSWGNGCAAARSPGVYAKIQIMLEWVKQQTGLS